MFGGEKKVFGHSDTVNNSTDKLDSPSLKWSLFESIEKKIQFYSVIINQS